MNRFQERFDRLGRALAIYEDYLTQRSGSGDQEELLERHPDLRDLLEPMLAGQEPDSRLSDPLAPPPTQDGHESAEVGLLRAGDCLGPYRVLEEIGSGGMGAVYLVEQEEPVRRRLALKLIKLGMDTREVVVRFELERQALALMDHPCIARVIDAAATAAGRPYFVMEYVPGPDLLTYCDEKRLTTPERLGLFARVCDALQHAHQKGIIHRDLKPSNILVTEQDTGPVPKVIDFGIAKATEKMLAERTLLTHSGQMIGTPEYMSPEQARSEGDDVDTRTDIYSLGVLLYELLVGELPFRPRKPGRAGIEALLDEICERDPPKPSTVVTRKGIDTDLLAERRRTPTTVLYRQLRGDLDWIVLKALEKDRERRYASMAEFATDIRRFLEDMPIAARPPSKVYRLRKFVRRYRIQVAAAGFVLASLVVGLVVSALLYFKAEEARRDAEQNAETARQVTDYLVNLFQQATPRESLGEDLRVGEVLDQGVERLRREPVDDPVVRARLLSSLGQVYGALGIVEKAEPLLRESRKLWPGLHEDETFAYHLDTALGNVLEGRGAYRQALEVFEDLLSKLRAGPEPEPRQDKIAYALAKTGQLASRLDDTHRAETALGEALRLARAFPGEDDRILAEVLRLRGDYDFDQGHLEAARDHWLEAAGIFARNFPTGHPALSKFQIKLGRCYLRLGDREAARTAIEQAVAETSRFYGEEHHYLAYPLQAHAEYLFKAGHLDEAAGYYAQSLERMRRALGPEHRSLGQPLADLGALNYKRGQFAESRKLLGEALSIYRKLHVGDHIDTAVVLMNLGSTLTSLDQFQAAERHLEEAVAMCRRLESPRLVHGLNSLTYLRIAQRRFEEAMKFAAEVLKLSDGPDGDAAAHGLCRANLALIHNLHRRAKKGGEAAIDAIANLERAGLGDDARLANAHYQLGWSLQMQGKLDEAKTSLRRAIEIHERATPKGHPTAAFSYDLLGTLLLGEKKYDAALPHLRRALELRRRFLPESAHFRIVSTHNLGALQFSLGNYAAARLLMDEAIRLRRKHFKVPNSDLAASLLWAAQIDMKTGQLERAEQSATECLRQQKQLLPKNHWITANTTSLLGAIRMRRGDHAQAQKLLEEALQHLGRGTVYRRRTLERLVELHEQRGETEAAEKYRKELADR